MAAIPVISREYVRVPVYAAGDGLADMTSLPVHFAFLVAVTDRPGDGDWTLGSWDPDPLDTVPEWASVGAVARCLVGPEAHELAAGRWYVWVWIDGAIEEPRRYVGTLRIAA